MPAADDERCGVGEAAELAWQGESGLVAGGDDVHAGEGVRSGEFDGCLFFAGGHRNDLEIGAALGL